MSNIQMHLIWCWIFLVIFQPFTRLSPLVLSLPCPLPGGSQKMAQRVSGTISRAGWGWGVTVGRTAAITVTIVTTTTITTTNKTNIHHHIFPHNHKTTRINKCLSRCRLLEGLDSSFWGHRWNGPTIALSPHIESWQLRVPWGQS